MGFLLWSKIQEMTMNKDGQLQLLKEKISFIDNLLNEIDWEGLRQWREEVLIVLDALISEDSKYYKSFENIRYRSAVISMGDVEGNKSRHESSYKDGLKKARASLKAVLFGVEKGLF